MKKYEVTLSAIIETDSEDYDEILDLAVSKMQACDGSNITDEFSSSVTEINKSNPVKFPLPFIRMINTETGEVRQTNACDAGYNALSNLIKTEPYVMHVVFEGNEFFVEKLNSDLRQHLSRHEW